MASSSLFRKKSIDKIIKDAEDGLADGHGGAGLKKILNVRDLTFMGIAAVVGAGIFSTIGKAAYSHIRQQGDKSDDYKCRHINEKLRPE